MIESIRPENVRTAKACLGFWLQHLPQACEISHAEVAIALAELQQEFSAIALSRETPCSEQAQLLVST
jgi:hypothetical protein